MKLFVSLVIGTTAIAQPSNTTVLHRGDHMTFRDAIAFRITDEEQVNRLPFVRFMSHEGKAALTVPMGTTQRELFIRSDVEGAPPPIVRSFFVKGPTPELNVVIPVTMIGSGSDCGYDATVVGLTNGRPKAWLTEQPFVNTEGGYYVGDLGPKRGYGFAAWNFIWEDGAHYGPHRYEVWLYKFLPESGSAVLIQHIETDKKFDTPEEALKSLGLNFNNLLRLDKGFDC